MLLAEKACVMERFEELKGTLNGAPAVVCGRYLDFAYVAALDGSGVRAEFSWETLRRLVRAEKVNLRAA